MIRFIKQLFYNEIKHTKVKSQKPPGIESMATSYNHNPHNPLYVLHRWYWILQQPFPVAAGCSSFSPSPYKSFNVWPSCWAFVLCSHALSHSFSLQSARHAAFSQVHYRPCMVSIIVLIQVHLPIALCLLKCSIFLLVIVGQHSVVEWIPLHI